MTSETGLAFPSIKRSIVSLIEDEEGGIPAGRLLTIGSLVVLFSFIYAVEAYAAHSSHRSHSSHKSHSSHSSHKSSSHSSHGSHSNHSNHSSSTAQASTNSGFQANAASEAAVAGIMQSNILLGTFSDGIYVSTFTSGTDEIPVAVSIDGGEIDSLIVDSNTASTGALKAMAVNDCLDQANGGEKDGTFKSSYTSKNGKTVEVSVTIKNGSFESIKFGSESAARAEGIAHAVNDCLVQATE